MIHPLKLLHFHFNKSLIIIEYQVIIAWHLQYNARNVCEETSVVR